MEVTKTVFLEVMGESPYMKVLDFFLDNIVYDYSKTDIYENTGVSRVTLQEIIKDLEKKGIIKKTRKVGRAQMYKINKDSPLTKQLMKFEWELREVAYQNTFGKKEIAKEERKAVEA